MENICFPSMYLPYLPIISERCEGHSSMQQQIQMIPRAYFQRPGERGDTVFLLRGLGQTDLTCWVICPDGPAFGRRLVQWPSQYYSALGDSPWILGDRLAPASPRAGDWENNKDDDENNYESYQFYWMSSKRPGNVQGFSHTVSCLIPKLSCDLLI